MKKTIPSAVRIAIVGCGAVAERGHAPAMGRLGLAPSVVVDVDPSRAERFARTFGGRPETDYRKVSTQADVAIVALPGPLHCAVACDLLRMGLHVLVEKPLAMSSKECDLLIGTAQTTGRVLEVGLMRRHLRANSWLAAAVRSGQFGAVKSFDLAEGYRFNWPVASASFFAPSNGGVLMDTGPHALDLITWLVDDLHVTAYADDSRGGVEADCVIALEGGSATSGIVELSRTRELRNTLRLETEAGHVELGIYGDMLRLPDGFSPQPRRWTIGQWSRQSVSDLFAEQLRRWLLAAQGGGQVAVGGVAARSSIVLLEECAAKRRPLISRWSSSSLGVPTVTAPRSNRRDRRVLVTGAGGFIGARVVERLLDEEATTIRALVHSFSGAPRVGRFGVEILQGDIADPDDMARAVSGCSAVVHCAYDSVRPEVNAPSASILAQACIDEGVQRIVHLSSLSVYEPLTGNVVTEASPRAKTGWPYADAKLATEEELLRWHQKAGLPVVILQPTIVYGPFSGAWTTRIARMLKESIVALPDDGMGICNAVYIDDVVSAVLLALEEPQAVGESILVTGSEPVTWRQFFTGYEEILGIRSTTFVNSEELSAIHATPSPRHRLEHVLRNPGTLVKSALPSAWLDPMKTALGQRRLECIRRALPTPYTYPDPQALALYNSRAVVDGSRANAVLGFRPEYSFGAGMQLTAEFLRWANLV